MSLLTPEQRKIVDDGIFYRWMKSSRFYGDMLHMLSDYAETALEELRSYTGGNEKEMAHRVRVWQARCDVQRWFEMHVDGEIKELEDLIEESGLNLDELEMRSNVNG